MIPMKSTKSSKPLSPSAAFASVTVHNALSVALALTGLVLLSVDGCAVSNCYESLRGVIGSVDHQLIFPFYTDDELNLLCQVYKDTQPCVASTIDECMPSERVIVEGFDLAVRFLCHDGYIAYRRHRKCFVSKPVVRVAENCNTTYVTQLNDLKRGGKTILQKKSLLCSHVDELVTCVRDGVTEMCGIAAGQLIFSLKTSIQKPVKEGMGCAGVTDPMSQEPPVIFIVIVGSLVFVAVVLMTAIIHRRLKTSRSNLGASSSDRCYGGRRLCIFGRHFRRPGRRHLVESKTSTTDTGADRMMKISNIESESSVTLQGTNFMERESTTLSKPLLEPVVLGVVSQIDDKK